MKLTVPGTLLAVIAVSVVALSGCGSSPTEQGNSGSPAASEDHGSHDHGQHGDHAGDGQSDMEKMKAELAKLSPEDAASAEKQHVCPVSGKMLGTMGAPQKIDVKGQDVWICCAGCKDPLLEKPDEYLAKLKKE